MQYRCKYLVLLAPLGTLLLAGDGGFPTDVTLLSFVELLAPELNDLP